MSVEALSTSSLSFTFLTVLVLLGSTFKISVLLQRSTSTQLQAIKSDMRLQAEHMLNLMCLLNYD